MTQEEKDKLLKYLCAALPYEVMVNYGGYDGCDYKLTLTTLQDFPTEDLKPYLRPMSSMTDEEKEEYELFANRTIVTSVGFVHLEAIELIEWLLKKHFDFMVLIPMGAAIEVTEDNNPYKD